MTTVDVLVVGGGPSGLAAATAAAEAGASVMLVDEWPELGGWLRYRRAHVEVDGRSVGPTQLVESLVGGAQKAGVTLRPGTVTWAAFAGADGLEVGVRGAGDSQVVTPSRLVLATGTTDRVATVPGATLPGVVTARAMQRLLNVHGVRPGRRFALLGDDRVDELTEDIAVAGGVVMAAVRTADVESVVIHGRDAVRGISVGEERTAVDVVVLALGTLPDTQLARMLGGDSPPRVTLCGSAASRPGATAASWPAAIEAARAGGGRASGDDSRWLCRCECISVAAVAHAVAEGNRTVNDVKRRTRAGMGICQGIFCVEQITAALVDAGVDLVGIEPMTPRPPTRLTALGAIDRDESNVGQPSAT